jgi:ABC-type amino acid transport substrate-binding protein
MNSTCRLRSASLAALLAVLSPLAALAADKPAGAEKTTITNWTDPRQVSWTQKYPLFGPVEFGDGSLKRLQDGGELRVCAPLQSPPYIYKDIKTGEVIGKDADFTHAIAKKLGIAKAVFVDTDFPALIPALSANRCDVVISSLIIRSDRAKAPGVRYTYPYGLIFDQLVVRKDSAYEKLEDMKGTTISSVTGSTDLGTLEAAIKIMGGGIQTNAFNGSSECFLSVVQKLSAGCMYDNGSTVGALKQYKDLRAIDKLYTFVPIGKYANEPEVNPYVFGSVGMVTHLEDNDFNRALSIIIKEMVADGSQKEILNRWGMWNDAQLDMIRVKD